MEIYYITFPNICIFKTVYNNVFFKMANKSNDVCLVTVVTLTQLGCGGNHCSRRVGTKGKTLASD